MSSAFDRRDLLLQPGDVVLDLALVVALEDRLEEVLDAGVAGRRSAALWSSAGSSHAGRAAGAERSRRRSTVWPPYRSRIGTPVAARTEGRNHPRPARPGSRVAARRAAASIQRGRGPRRRSPARADRHGASDRARARRPPTARSSSRARSGHSPSSRCASAMRTVTCASPGAARPLLVQQGEALARAAPVVASTAPSQGEVGVRARALDARALEHGSRLGRPAVPQQPHGLLFDSSPAPSPGSCRPRPDAAAPGRPRSCITLRARGTPASTSANCRPVGRQGRPRASATARTIETTPPAGPARGSPGSSSRIAWPPSSGTMGSRLSTLQPTRREDRRPQRVTPVRPNGSSRPSRAARAAAPPSTSPTAGPAREMPSEVSRDSCRGGVYGRDAAQRHRARSPGCAPVRRAAKACPSSCSSTAKNASTHPDDELGEGRPRLVAEQADEQHEGQVDVHGEPEQAERRQRATALHRRAHRASLVVDGCDLEVPRLSPSAAAARGSSATQRVEAYNGAVRHPVPQAPLSARRRRVRRVRPGARARREAVVLDRPGHLRRDGDATRGPPAPSRPTGRPTAASRRRCGRRRRRRCGRGRRREPRRTGSSALALLTRRRARGRATRSSRPRSRPRAGRPPRRSAGSPAGVCSGLRTMTRVAGRSSSSSNGTNSSSPASSPGGKGAVIRNPTPTSSTAYRAVGRYSRSSAQGRRGVERDRVHDLVARRAGAGSRRTVTPAVAADTARPSVSPSRSSTGQRRRAASARWRRRRGGPAATTAPDGSRTRSLSASS